MMASTPRMCSVSDTRKGDCRTGALHTLHGGLQVRRNQVVNGYSGKPVAEGLVALVNTSDVVASHRTDNTG